MLLRRLQDHGHRGVGLFCHLLFDEFIKELGWIFDPDNLILTDPVGARQELQPRTGAVLAELIAHEGAIVDREQLMSVVWTETVVADDSLYRCVHQLRSAFASSEAAGPSITTIRNRGYRLEREPSVHSVPGSSAVPDRTPTPPTASLIRRHRRRPMPGILAFAAVASLLTAGIVSMAARPDAVDNPASPLLSVVFMDTLNEMPELEVRPAEADSILQGLRHMKPGFSWTSDTDSTTTHR